MILSDISIKRPVFATVISLLLLAFGAVSYSKLSLREYPDIDPPIVTVEVEYPGAPANIIETRITQIIEDRISGIEGIEYIQSSSRDGNSRVTIEFSVDRDIDAAANDVRDRIAGVQDNMPEEADPPEVQKVDSNDDVVVWRNLVSDHLSVPELTDFADRYIVDQYATLDGVARVRLGGGKRYAMRVWLDRQQLAARNLSVSDVENALRRENIELPAGKLESSQLLFQARVARHFKTTDDFLQLVLKEGDDGYLVRLGDVARAELDVVENRIIFHGNGKSMIGVGIIKQSTANTIDVAHKVAELSEKLNKTLPEGMALMASYDASVFVKASVNEVFKTLFVAIGCVICIIYIFLGSLRATLIPALTVPISIVATFIVINALGFSINLLTLLALVLAIGLVVDDAIVMLENIVRRMHDYGESPLVASYNGSREVGFAVVATTLVLVSVFVPITFMEGDLGRLFTEFALTIAAAVGFSAFIALTLSPMMASKLLVHSNDKPRAIVKRVNAIVNQLRRHYLRYVFWLLRNPKLVIFSFPIAILLVYILFKAVPSEFAPLEDRGTIYVVVNGPEGASFDYMSEYMLEIESRLMRYIDSGEAKRLLVRSPRGLGTISNFNSGVAVVVLEDWSQRRSAWEIMDELRADLGNLPGVQVFPIMRQGLGGGTGKPVQFVLSGSTYEELAEWRDIMLTEIAETNPGFIGLDSDYKETRPQLDFVIDYDRAASLGVSTREIGNTLETMLGGRRVTTYLERGEEYDVLVEGERADQHSISDTKAIYVRSDRTGQLIPLANLVNVKEYAAAQTLSRYNRLRSITLESNLADGFRLGEALKYLNQLARDKLPDHAVIDYKGQSKNFITSGASIQFVFMLGLIVVFLVLSAQFESFVHPLVIMLTVPLSVGGGLFGLWLVGSSLNIYSQVGLIMLVGLSAKNGILIVEFANQLRDRGMAFSRALIQACATRFRPIIMTGLTTVAGALPLVFSFGAGAETRFAIGIVILFGVLASTIFTLFLIPVAYSLIARGTGSPSDIAKQLDGEISQTIGNT